MSEVEGQELLALQRLESEFGRYRAEFQRTRDDVLQLNGEFANLKSSVQGEIGDLKASINSISTKLDEKSKTNWPAIALAISMVPAVWLFVTTYTANAISPTNAQTVLNNESIKHISGDLNTLQQITSSTAASDASSRSDRSQLNDRVRILEGSLATEIADRKSMSAATRVSLAEIETQFRALNNIENLRAAQQERLNSLMWEKSNPGERYPNSTFFPPNPFGDTDNKPNP